MPKKTKTPKFGTTRNSIILCIAVLVVAFGASFAYAKITNYDTATDQAGIVSIRELILLAVRGTKKDAPVDPKTGDIYFPEARLYLPDPKQVLPITYSMDDGDTANSHDNLTVSTYPVKGTEKLYMAENTTELFNVVPHLQACSRGVKLSYQAFPANDTDNQLKSNVTLNNGKALYIYVEKACPDLDNLATVLKNVKAY